MMTSNYGEHFRDGNDVISSEHFRDGDDVISSEHFRNGDELLLWRTFS